MHKSLLKLVFNTILCASLMLGAATFTSCQDYDDDINNLEQKVSALEAAVNDLKTQISNGAVISNVAQNANGVTITLSNGKSYEITNGQDGTPGSVVSIGENGNWFIDGKDTGKPSQGEKGDTGAAGEAGTAGTVAPTVYYYPETEGENAGLWVKVTEVAGKEPVKEATDDKWLPEGTITAVLSKDVLTLKNVKDAENGEVKLYLTDALGSLVFIPELYEDGVEADKYEFARGGYMDIVPAEDAPNYDKTDKVLKGETYNGVPYTIAKDVTVAWKPALDEDDDPIRYFYPSIAEMYYHMNPINANIDGATWKFLGATPEYVATKSGEAVIIPNMLSTPVKTDKGEKLKVEYQLTEDMIFGTEDNDYEDGISVPGWNEHISVIALEANFAETKAVVTSDYAAIMPALQYFTGISYTDEKTNDIRYTGIGACKAELYHTAEEAIKEQYTVELPYSKGAKNIADILEICYVEKYPKNNVSDEKAMTLAEIKAKYGLKLNFEVIPYTAGNNKTEEDAYIKLSDVEKGTVAPCYVNDSGASVVIPAGEAGEKVGRSAIGREPLVLVTLIDEANDNSVVLAGFIKLHITETDSPTEIVISKATPKLPYICGTQGVEITWADMSGKILEELDRTKDEFTSFYYVENYREEPAAYIKHEGKLVPVKGLQLKSDLANNNNHYYSRENDYYGVMDILDYENWFSSTTNDILTYVLNKTNLDRIKRDFDGTITLYARFAPRTDLSNGTITDATSVFIGVTIKVSEKPTIASFGLKRESYWFGENKDVVRTNVPVPTSTNNTLETTEYVKNLDEYFYHLDKDGKEVNGLTFELNYDKESYLGDYVKVWDNQVLNHSYYFDAKSEELTFVYPYHVKDEKFVPTTYKLYVHNLKKNADGLKGLRIYAAPAEIKADDLQTIFTTAPADNKYLVAVIEDVNNNGFPTIMKYQATEMGKYFLNMFAHSDEQLANSVIIGIKGSYSGVTAGLEVCEIPLEFENGNTFTERFLRPLDIVPNDEAEFEDAVTNGSEVEVGALFSVIDWRDKDVIEYNKTTKKYQGVDDNGVDLATYYGIESIVVDLTKVTSDVNKAGTFMPINTEVIDMTFTDENGAVQSDRVKSFTVAELGTLNVNYKNNEANVSGFKVRIPVTVNYVWGTIEEYAEVPVVRTIAN